MRITSIKLFFISLIWLSSVSAFSQTVVSGQNHDALDIMTELTEETINYSPLTPSYLSEDACVVNGGTIGGSTSFCGSGDPSTFTNSASATQSGCIVFGSPTMAYQWQKRSPGGSWADISGATGTTYNSGTLSSTTEFRRKATWPTPSTVGYSNTITVTIYSAPSGGTITGSQSICYNADVAAFGSSAGASGGNGSYSYQWETRLVGGSGWLAISGATGTTYNHGTLGVSTEYRRKVTSCSQVAYSNTLTVTVSGQVSGGSISSNQTICYGASASTLTNSSSPSGGTGGFSYAWEKKTTGSWSTISGATSSTYSPGTLTTTTQYRRKATNSCGSAYTSAVTITVNPDLSPGSIGNAQTVCYNGNPSALSNTGSASGGNSSYSYQWQSKPASGGSWANISGATSTTYDPGNLTSSTQYRRRVISCSQTKYTNTITVTVNPTLNAGNISGTQTICMLGTPSTFTSSSSASGGNGSYSYQWQKKTTGSWSDISGATSTAYSSGYLSETTQFRRRAISCGETKYSSTITVTVNPATSAGSIGNAQTVCYNGNPAALTNTASASGGNGSYSYQWESKPASGGSWSSISGATSTTYDPGNLTASTQYRRKVVSCGQTVYTNTITITVNPTLSAGSIGNGQTLCYNGDPSTLSSSSSASGGNGSYSYQWQSKPVTGGSWANVSGATSTTYNPPALTSSLQYRRRVISCSETKYSNTVTVTIHPNLTAGSISGTQTICMLNTPSTLGNSSSASGGDGSLNYQWQSKPSGGSWADISGATSSTYSPGALSQTTEYRREVTSCNQTVLSNSITVTVYSAVSPGSIGNAQTICYNDDPSALTSTALPSGGNGSYTYQWQVKPSGGNWADISGATSTTYNPGVLTATTEYRRRASSCGQNVYSGAVTVTVNPTLVAGTISNAQTICYNANPSAVGSLANASGGNGSYSYQWQSKPASGGSWANISGATSNTYDPSSLTSSTSYRRVATSCGETKNSNTITITVNPTLNAGGIGNAQTICYNDNPSAISSTSVASGGNGGYTYQWQSKPASSGSWANISGATSSTYDPSNLTSSTSYRRVATSCGETKNSNTITITVHPQLTVGSIGNAQTICYNNNPSALTSTANATGGDGNLAYQWQSKPVGSGSWTDIAGATSSTYDPSNLTASTEYRRKVSSCSVTLYSNAITVTVHPDLNAGGLSSTQTICYNDVPSTLTGLPATGGNGAYAYQWQSKPSGGSWGNISGATSATYSPAALTTTTEYKRLVTSCGVTKETGAITVTVRPDLNAGSVSGTQTICYNSSPTTLSSVDATGGDGSYTYQWQSKPVGSGSWANISGATNASYSPGTMTTSQEYKRLVTSCGDTKTSNTITVTVNPALTSGSITGTQTVCYNETPTSFSQSPASGGDGSLNYQWQSKPLGVAPWDDITGATSASYTPGGLTATTEFRRQVISCGETKHTAIITVTVYPPVQSGAIAGIQTICYDSTPTTLTSTTVGSGGDGNITYQWQSKPNGGNWGDISGATSATYSPGNLTVTTEFRRKALSCSQEDASDPITVTVNPELAPGAINGIQTVCYNEVPTAIGSATPASGGDGSYEYAWQSRPAGSTGAWLTLTEEENATYSPGAMTASTEFRRKVESCNDTKYTDFITITVRPQLTAGVVSNSQTICYNDTPTLTATAATGGDGVYGYQWFKKGPSDNDFVALIGEDQEDYSPGALTVTTEFKREDSSCNETKFTNTIIVTVHPELTAGTLDANDAQTICYNSAPAEITSTGAHTGGDPSNFTYQWESKPSGGNWGDISGANSASYTPGILTVTTDFRRKVSSCGDVETTNTVTITVNPDMNPGSIGGTQTICYSEVPAVLNSVADASGGDGNPIYEWEVRPAGSSGGWLKVPSSNVAALTLGALTASTEYRRLATSATCSDTKISNVVTITVHPQLDEGSITGDATVCYNDVPPAFTNIAASGGDGTINYQWQSRAPAGIWADIVGEISASYTPGALTSTTEFRREASSCNAVEYTNTVVVTVNELVTAGTIATAQTICYNDTPAPLTSTTDADKGDGSYAYQWQQKVGAGSWDNISGATVSTYSPGALTATTEFQRRVISCGDTVYTAPVVITVNPQLDAGAIDQDQTICYGEIPAVLTSTTDAFGGDGSYTYEWKTRPAGSSGSWLNIPDSDTVALVLGALSVSTEYRRQVISCNDTTETNTVTITVTPTLVAGTVSSDQTICYNDAPTLTATAATGGDGSYTYQWHKREITDPGFTPISGATGKDYIPGPLTITTKFKRFDSSCIQTFETNSVTITVRDQLSGGAISQNQDICFNDAPATFTSITPIGGTDLGGDGNYTFEWQISTDNVNWTPIASTNVENYTHGALTQDSYFRRKVTSCGDTAYSTVITVTVTDDIQDFVFANTQAAFCSDEQANVVLGGSQPNVIYQLRKDGVAEGATVTGDGNPIHWNVSAAGSYTVDANFPSCGVVTMSDTINIVIDTAPLVYNVIGGGQQCVGVPSSISLVDSDSGMNYYLSRNGVVDNSTKIVGTGDTLVWSNIFELGTYNVVALTPACGYVNMNNQSSAISFLPIPPAPEVRDTVFYNNTGVQVELPNPDSTAIYHWYAADTLSQTGDKYTFFSLDASTTLKVQAEINGCLSEFAEVNVFLSNVYPPDVPEQVTACGEQFLQVADTVTLPQDVEWYWQGTNANGTEKTLRASRHKLRLLKDGTYYIRAYDEVQKVWGPESTSITVSISDPTRFIPIACDDITADYVEPTPDAYIIGSKYNFVRSYDATRPGMSVDSILNETDVRFVRQTAGYIDGLGRQLQTVQKGASPDTTDMVQMMHYDALSRNSLNYLPYTATDSDGSIKKDPFGEQEDFYSGNGGSILPHFPNEDVFYSKTIFEESPANRAKLAMAPGDAWAGSGVGTEQIYNVNSLEDSVIVWRLNTNDTYPVADTIYLAGELTHSESLDEQENSVREFTDKIGQVILKRVQDAESPGNGHVGWLNTYYIYDNFGQLRFVLPPRALEVLADASWTWNATDMDQLVFQYTYDQRGRMITKQVPGAGEVHMVYDKMDRLVLTQDANQRNNDIWTFTKYEELNRPVMTGFYTYTDQDSTLSDRVALQDSLDNWTLQHFVKTEAMDTVGVVEGYDLVVSTHVPGTTKYKASNTITFLEGFETEEEFDAIIDNDLSTHYTFYQGYYDATFPLMKNGNTEVITVNYYDNYDFTDRTFTTVTPGFYDPSSATGLSLNAESPEVHLEMQGLATGSRVKILGTANDWLTTVMYYDKRGRVIQTHSDNHLGGEDVTTTQYDFVGKALHTYTQHTNPQAYTDSTTTVFKRFHYDHMDRLVSIEDQLNDSTALKTIVSNSYNALGELDKKTLDDNLETLDYDYNVRGWLSSVNKAFISDSTVNNYFGMELSYAEGYNKAYRNGNISGMKWRTQSFAETMSYGFGYDKSNRLTKADYGQGTNWGLSKANFSVSNLKYDANGNIESLKRIGMVADVAQTIDNLAYSYMNNGKSNQLAAVYDSAGYKNQGDFKDGNTSGNDYGYDANGNMVMDKNKTINSGGDIVYNHLNLPTKITFEGNASKSIEYLYDAAGIKLQKKVTDGANITQTDYIGGFIYENEYLMQFAHEEGRVRKQGGELHYDYYIKDHLGNTRMTLTDESDTTIYFATMETEYDTYEEGLFLNLDNVRNGLVTAANYTIDNTITADESARLNGTDSLLRIGPAKMLVVSPGDVVDIEVFGYHTGNYTDAGSINQSALVGTLAAAFGGFDGGNSEGQAIFDMFDNSGGLAFVGNNADPNSPRAYINYILFDNNLNYVDAGYQQVSNTANTHQQLTLSKRVTGNGYLYIYTSNESAANHNVFFDDLKITHKEGAILQEDHYYPFGMNISALSSTVPLSKPNPFKYNEGSEFHSDFDLNSYETLLRSLDPILGRWWQVDPASELMLDQSPYSSMDNNPIRFNDPLGDCPTCPQGEEADNIYAKGALVTNKHGSWQYLGGGKWKDVSGNPSTASNNNTNYYYDQEDWEARVALFSLGVGNPITKELIRRESSGQYQPITAINYLNTIDERAARLGIFALYASGSLYYSGGVGRMPSARSVTFTARYSGSSGGTKLTGVYELQATHNITMSNRQFAKIKADIKQHGIRQPIKYTTYRGKKYVVDGHHRLRAARELGMKNIPAEEVSLPYAGYKTTMDLIYTHY